MSDVITPRHSAAQGNLSEKVNPGTNGYLVSKKYAWYVFSLLFVLMMFDFIDRQVIASLFPFLKKDWGITDAQCGLLLAAVNWSITIAAIPVGIIADRWSRKKTVGLMAVFWSLATMACAFTRSFGQLFLMRFFIGVGEAGYAPAGNSLISALFPLRLRARLIGLFAAGAAVIGGALGLILGGSIAAHYGWRNALGIVALPGMIFAILFFFIRDYKTVELTIRASSEKGSEIQRKMTKKEIAKNILGKPSILLLYGGQTVALFYVSLVGAWLPSFFIRVHHMTVVEASTKAGLAFLGSIIGTFLGGYLADRVVARGRTNGRPLVAALMQLLAFLFYLSAFGLVQGKAQILFLFLGGMLCNAFQGPCVSGIAELVHAGLRSTALSILIFIQNLVGMALGPIVAGALSDKYGIGTALLALSFLPAVSMLLFFLVLIFYNRDMASVEQVELSME